MRTLPRGVVAVMAALPMALASCSSGSSPGAGSPSSTPTPSATASSTPAPTASPTASAQSVVSVYFLHGGKLQPMHRTVAAPAVGAGALRALLAGPSAAESSAGVVTAIPTGTVLLDLTIAGGVATVDLSGGYASGGGSASLTARLAQVVFTLTQFPTVQRVLVHLDGRAVSSFGGAGISLTQPVTRATYESVSPAILVESPTFGELVRSPIRVRGTANVFEATLWLELRDRTGHALVAQRVQATSGTGTRGTFVATLTFATLVRQPGTLVAFDISMRDGSRQDVSTIAVQLSP